jgi:DNA topoisomerase-1
VALLADKRAGGGRPQRGQAAALAELGVHPEDGKPIRVLSGRFGPYIKHGDTNANVPKGADPAALTLEEAVALIADRVAKGGGGKKPAKKAAAKKAPAKAKAAAADGAAPAKKAPAKKPAAKKTTAAKKPAAKKAKAEA